MINSIFLNLKQVKLKTSFSHTTIYRLMAENKFPQPINISDQRVAWLESEIQEWVETKIAKSRGGNCNVCN